MHVCEYRSKEGFALRFDKEASGVYNLSPYKPVPPVQPGSSHVVPSERI